jgi:hypothetical protein
VHELEEARDHLTRIKVEILERKAEEEMRLNDKVKEMNAHYK